MLKRQIKQR